MRTVAEEIERAPVGPKREERAGRRLDPEERELAWWQDPANRRDALALIAKGLACGELKLAGLVKRMEDIGAGRSVAANEVRAAGLMIGSAESEWRAGCRLWEAREAAK